MVQITPPDPTLQGLQARLLDFHHALRDAGVGVAISDGMDAMRAATVVDLMDRAVFREALAATLTSSASHRVAFDTLFDIYFPRTHALPGEEEAPTDSSSDAAGQTDQRDPMDFLSDLVDQLMEGDDGVLRRMAQQAVGQFGRVEERGRVEFVLRLPRLPALQSARPAASAAAGGRDRGVRRPGLASGRR